MKKALVILLFLSIIASAKMDFSGADTTLVTLVSTYPERADPLEEITLNLLITNTTSLMMWNPVISLDLSSDINDYFTLVDQEVVVDMGNQNFVPVNGTISTSYRIFVNSNCPAQKHIIPVKISYRSGACEGGCQNAEITGQIAVPIYRQDPKVAMSITGPTEVLPGDPLIVSAEFRNLGTGSALGLQISATSDPIIADLQTAIKNGSEDLELMVSSTLTATVSADTMKMEPGYYTFYVYLQYEDKYGNIMFKNDEWEVKLVGTPSQEALFQADQLKELGINAYQIKSYTTAISYLERAIELYARFDKDLEIQECESYIYLSTNYLQANNYFNIGEQYFLEKDYLNAKNYFSLARDTYSQLGNTKKVAEANSRIDTCEEELYRYQTMEYGIFGSILFCLAYGLIAKRKAIYERVRR